LGKLVMSTIGPTSMGAEPAGVFIDGVVNEACVTPAGSTIRTGSPPVLPVFQAAVLPGNAIVLAAAEVCGTSDRSGLAAPSVLSELGV
jgi:hypothetical protein